MNGVILLNYNENTKQVEDEEKMKFLHSLLEQMGVPIEDFWTEESLSIENRIKLRNVLNTYSIQVIDDLDGNLQVYVEDQKIGEWNKCKYKLKRDLKQLDPKKQFYLEMEVNYWTIFEQETE